MNPNGSSSQNRVPQVTRTRLRGGSEKNRFSYIFTWELHERLLWFGKLRWVAAGGLALASVLGPFFSMPSTRPSLAVVAALVPLLVRRKLIYERQKREEGG